MLIPVPENEFEDLKAHFIDYITELLPYEKDRKITDDQSWKLQLDPRVFKFWIYEGVERVGFIFISYCELWQITQIYIFPEFRHRRYATKAVKQLFVKPEVLIGVLKKNPAMKFWKRFKPYSVGEDPDQDAAFYILNGDLI